jgi:hypothetical protein
MQHRLGAGSVHVAARHGGTSGMLMTLDRSMFPSWRHQVRSMCRGIPPGGGRIIACLARNGSQLSAQCRDALAELRD